MKKYLPFVLIGAGILVLIIAFIVVRTKTSSKPAVSVVQEDQTIPEIPTDKLPFVSLVPLKGSQASTPTPRDGCALKLFVKNIAVAGATTLDYELLYKVKDGRTQGAPGSVTLNGESEFDREILLGSESSGKVRCDDGVETGTLTLRFRNDQGKTIGKLATDFRLTTGTTKPLTSVDGSFEYDLSSAAAKTFFVIMQSFGPSYNFNKPISTTPYGIFATDTKTYQGEVKLSGTVYKWDGEKWSQMTSSKSSDIGVFLSI